MIKHARWSRSLLLCSEIKLKRKWVRAIATIMRTRKSCAGPVPLIPWKKDNEGVCEGVIDDVPNWPGPHWGTWGRTWGKGSQRERQWTDGSACMWLQQHLTHDPRWRIPGSGGGGRYGRDTRASSSGWGFSARVKRSVQEWRVREPTFEDMRRLALGLLRASNPFISTISTVIIDWICKYQMSPLWDMEGLCLTSVLAMSQAPIDASSLSLMVR